MNDPSKLIDAAATLAKEALRFFLPHEEAESQQHATSKKGCGSDHGESSSHEDSCNPNH